VANSAFHPSGVGKWVPASAGKAKAGMAHSVSGWTRGVQVKLWDPSRMRAIPERLKGVFTIRRYTNPRLPLPLPLPYLTMFLLTSKLALASPPPEQPQSNWNFKCAELSQTLNWRSTTFSAILLLLLSFVTPRGSKAVQMSQNYSSSKRNYARSATW